MSQPYHVPIMVSEVIDGLKIQPDAWYVDATIGGGGHSQAILAAGGKVLGIDQDDEALDEVKRRFKESRILNLESRLSLVKANFVDMNEVVRQHLDQPVMGILFDLGVSSHQLDDLSRGFSFDSASLDMRMDPSQGASAADLVAQLNVADLTRLFVELGEERYARKFAQAIVTARRSSPIDSGQRLAEIIAQASPPAYRYGRIHPATRAFQALRMAVNGELSVLEMVLPQAVELLAENGRLAVMSFHSLEDRLVKHFFASSADLMVLSKKPIVANSSEVDINPRSRSAKLRLAEKHLNSDHA